ncbi:538_t:CDS:2 [Funneliformis caledonium]|uniref:538_t:CDS:1 n=2 Tax=Funneliformis TaxID=1117308 RepID=A0A9N9APA0_9GLOM|nr:538_t:CDS:2 [Funneliformis caledonium]CAG8566252.1 5290_t:CDS:2 [Funneliformis mosseae]
MNPCCSELQEQLLTQRQINRDQSRLIDGKQQIIEDQARLTKSQQQLIDMMYEKIQTLENDISKLKGEGGGKYEFKVFLRNVKPSLTPKMLKIHLERSFGPIHEISQPDPKSPYAFAYFKNRQHFLQALEKGNINIDGINVKITSGPKK